jgi:hypothetical protein
MLNAGKNVGKKLISIKRAYMPDLILHTRDAAYYPTTSRGND